MHLLTAAAVTAKALPALHESVPSLFTNSNVDSRGYELLGLATVHRTGRLPAVLCLDMYVDDFKGTVNAEFTVVVPLAITDRTC